MIVRTTAPLPSRLGAIILICISAFAQEPAEVLRRTGESYKNARSYSLEGTDTVEQVTAGNQRVTARRFHAYRLDASMRVDFADGGMRLTDGKSEWNYNTQTREYTRKAVPWDRRGIRVLHEFFYNYDGIADFVKRAEFISPPGKDGFLIEVTYELPGGVAAESIKNFWIDPNFTVRREISYPRAFESRAKFTRTLTFEKTTFNTPLDPALFSIRPPHAPKASGAAPDFTLPDLAGAPVSLKDLRGKVVVLYFWATWCATCRAEMPRLEKLVREYADDELVLIGINDEDPGIASGYLKANGHPLRSLVDRWQHVYRKYGVEEIPAVIVIGKDGRILPGLKEAGLE
jgi:peroxiredoxin/outer membrane lipoprotein-sorting protein